MNKKLFIVALGCATIAPCLEARRQRSPFAEMPNEMREIVEEAFDRPFFKEPSFFDERDDFLKQSAHTPLTISYTDTDEALVLTFSNIAQATASVGKNLIKIKLPDRELELTYHETPSKKKKFLLITDTYHSSSEISNQEEDNAPDYYYARKEARSQSYQRLALKETLKFAETENKDIKHDPKAKTLTLSIPKEKVEMRPLDITIVESEKEEISTEKSKENTES